MTSHDYWHERWQSDRIGFHEADGNDLLRSHWRWQGRRVLVPLCGKSSDLRWLAEGGNQVVGVELSGLAARAFFEENDLAYEVVPGELSVYRASALPIEIHVGDYFAFVGPPCDAHYDRAALVALPPPDRARYAAHTDSLLTPDAARLVITFAYEQSLADGPPYSVPDDELRSLWPGLERVASCNALDRSPPKFRAAGVRELVETVWRSADAPRGDQR